MRRFLLSTAPAALPSTAVAACWRALDGAPPPRELLRTPSVALFASGADPGHLHTDDGGFCFLPAHPPLSWRQRGPVPAAALLTAVRERGAAALADLLPPFAAVVQAEPHGPVLVATDANGLQQVCAAADHAGVLVSDSALLLAAATDAELDRDAVLTYLRIGHYLGADTPFRGIERLRGGTAWTLAGAVRTTVPVPAAEARPLAGAACVRECVQTLLAADPATMVELSGGLDSRLIVAALGRDACRGRPAVTLGTRDGDDVVVAGRIARELDFDWQFVDLAGIPQLADDAVLPLVRRASLRCDHTTQPLARAVLEWVNAQVPSRPRFSGQNGELARGFFYPGFPDHAAIGEPLVGRLLHWRLATNDSIDRTLVAADAWQAHEAKLLQRLAALLRAGGTRWAVATDEFYLHERMQRWVGAAYSAETTDHAVRAPFFDPRFVAWARQLAPHDKRDSRAMARLCAELDGWLGRLPTAGGLSPAMQGSNGPWAIARRRARFVHKVVRKVTQRLVGARRAPIGAPEFARRLLALGWTSAERFPHVAQLDWLRHDAIAGVLARGPASAASLGHLLALEWLLAARASGRRSRA
ncbi:MAG: hypothetical protein JNL08_12290 [Planctomycetes bacterium]|nr:hypothetical protein [Planctomycetota bacterium]